LALALAGCAYLLALQISIGYPYQYGGFFSDGVSYLYMADILSGGDSQTRPIALLHWRHAQFPPGYPAILALFGAGSDNPVRGLVLQAAIGVAVSLALVTWFRKLVGNLEGALLLSIPCLMMPWHFPWTFEIASEPLFLLLVLGLVLVAQSSLPDQRKLWLLALICGLLCVVRNAGAPMALAIVTWATARRLGRLQIVAAFAASLAPMLGWMAFKQTVQARASYADALPLVLDSLLVEPAALAASQAKAFLVGLSFNQQADRLGLALALVLLALALPSVLKRCRQGELDAWFLACYLPLALLWPYPAESSRLLGVAQPLLLVQAWITLRAILARRDVLAPARTAAAICIGLTLVTPGGTSMLARAHHAAADPTLDAYRRTAGWFLSPAPDGFAESAHRLILLARESQTLVPADACVYTTMPSLVSLHSKRMTWMTPAEIVAADGTPTAIRCAYFLVTNLDSLQKNAPPLHPLGSDGNQLRPIAVSQRSEHGQLVVEAALLQWAPAITQPQIDAANE